MENDKVIERLPLEHPLPEEIQKMERDDTVCQFCGVSYLIHREVKALEEELKKVKLELARYEGSEERERKLREDLERTVKEKDAAVFTTQERDMSIKKLMTEIEHKDYELKEVTQLRDILQNRLDEAEKSTDTFRKHQDSLKQRIPMIQSSVRQHKSDLHSIKTFVHQMGIAVQESSDTIRLTIQRVCAQETQEMTRLQDEISALERKRSSWQNGQGELEKNLTHAKAEIERLGQVGGHLKQKENQCSQLSSQIERLQTDLDDAITQRRMLSAEAAQFQELLKSKSQEIEDLHTQQRRREQISEQLSSKLQLELKQKGSELQVALSDYRKLQQGISDRERTDAEIQRQATLSMGETEQHRQVLLRTQEDCHALKAERELMVSSHQNRIEQLRESFRQKLTDAEKWPTKMDEMIQKERTRHSQDMQELQDKIKEAFKIELEIEKQKHQELTERYKMDYQEKENTLKAEIRSLTTRHKTELSQMGRQISTFKTQASSDEDSLKREVQGLKTVLADLQNRLGHAGSENDELVASLKAELREAEQDLTSSREESKSIEDKRAQSKEEILFLQETVRRECEERFELTETLSEAKEQLLAYQRHGALTSPQQRLTSATKSHKSDAPFGVNRKASTGSMQGGQSPKHGGQATGKVASSSVNIGFESNQARPPPVSRSKGGSMSDSRQRIAAAVGRR